MRSLRPIVALLWIIGSILAATVIPTPSPARADEVEQAIAVEVEVNISGAISYASSSVIYGTASFAPASGSLQSLSVNATIAGTAGAKGAVSISATSFLGFPIYFGSIAVSDPDAGTNVTAPLLFAPVRRNSDGSVTGSSTWFAFQPPLSFGPYTIRWKITGDTLVSPTSPIDGQRTSLIQSRNALVTDPTTRVETYPDQGVTFYVNGEGNCESLRVTADVKSLSTTSDVTIVEWDISSDCHIGAVHVDRLSQEAFRQSQGYGEGNEELTRTNPAAGKFPSGGVVEPNITYGNYIHSSQTVQDVVNIDVAKLRSHTDRNWNGSCTWWKHLRAVSSTSMPWNHPYKPGIVGSWQECGPFYVYSLAAANYHSDWLWCNFGSGWQELWLANWHYTWASGDWLASFFQNVSCPGTHMSTASWANTNPLG